MTCLVALVLVLGAWGGWTVVVHAPIRARRRPGERRAAPARRPCGWRGPSMSAGVYHVGSSARFVLGQR